MVLGCTHAEAQEEERLLAGGAGLFGSFPWLEQRVEVG